MKKSILIIAISTILFGCKSSTNNSDNSGEEIAVVKKNDTKSNKISELINSLENKDLSVANTLFDDSMTVNIRSNSAWNDNDYFNDTTLGLNKKAYLTSLDSTFVKFDSIKINNPLIQTQYNKNGESVSNIWAEWTAVGKMSRNKYLLPYRKVYVWKNDKIIKIIDLSSINSAVNIETLDPYGYNQTDAQYGYKADTSAYNAYYSAGSDSLAKKRKKKK
jgi:hypothetical protein